MVKCQINQIASLIKVSILKATNSESVGSFAGPHDGSAAIEVEATRTGTANRTAPIVAVRTDIEERTTAAEVAAARHGQF